jgi:hypothetical protein
LAISTWAVPTKAISPVGTVALSWGTLAAAGLRYEVASGVVTGGLPLTHSTTEQGRMLLPFTISVNVAVPAVMPDGERDVIVGVGSDDGGAVTVKSTALEVAKPPVTVMGTPGDVLWKAMSVAGIRAVSCVELTNFVVRGKPFQLTTAPFAKFMPFTVRVKPEALHEGVDAVAFVEDDKEAIEGGTIVKD